VVIDPNSPYIVVVEHQCDKDVECRLIKTQLDFSEEVKSFRDNFTLWICMMKYADPT
jgi:hypothetical protein